MAAFPLLEFHDLLRPSQSAYYPCHSTEMAQLKMTNNILLALDSGDMSDSGASFWICSLLSTLPTTIFSSTDFKFSSIDFKSLYGISGTVLSVLGPILFILCSAPFCSLIETHSVSNQSFADVTQLLQSCPPDQIYCLDHADVHL